MSKHLCDESCDFCESREDEKREKQEWSWFDYLLWLPVGILLLVVAAIISFASLFKAKPEDAVRSRTHAARVSNDA